MCRAALRRPEREEHEAFPPREGGAVGGRQVDQRRGKGSGECWAADGDRTHERSRVATELPAKAPILTVLWRPPSSTSTRPSSPRARCWRSVDLSTARGCCPVGVAQERLQPGGSISCGAPTKRGWNGRPRQELLSVARGVGTGPGERHRPGDFEKIVAPIIYAEALELFEDHLDAGRKSSWCRRLRSRSLPPRRLPRHRRVHRQPLPRRRRRPLHRRVWSSTPTGRTRRRPSGTPPSATASTWPGPTPTPTPSPTPRCSRSSATRVAVNPDRELARSPASWSGDPGLRPAREAPRRVRHRPRPDGGGRGRAGRRRPRASPATGGLRAAKARLAFGTRG